MSRSAETLVSKSTQLVHSSREMLEQLSPHAVAVIALCGAAGLVVLLWSRRRRFPPGDFSLPFVGPRNIGAPALYSTVQCTVHWVMCTACTSIRMCAREGFLPFVTFIEWSKRYKSDIVGFRVWPGIVNVVVCNTFASIREVLAGKEADALSGRVKSQLATLHNPEGLGAPTFTHLLSGPLESLGQSRRHSDACDVSHIVICTSILFVVRCLLGIGEMDGESWLIHRRYATLHILVLVYQ